jgi:hypothetical protein
MMDPKPDGAVLMNLAVDANEISIGEGFKLLKMLHVTSGHDAASMSDVNELTKKLACFSTHDGETAPAVVARFDAINARLKERGKQLLSVALPDVHLRERFLRALPTSGRRDFSEVLDKRHRGGFSNLAELQKAVVAEEKVLEKKASFSGDDSSAAAAAHAASANLVPVCTNAEQQKATTAQKRVKALAAAGGSGSSSTPPVQFPHDPWPNAPACTDDSLCDLGTGSAEHSC